MSSTITVKETNDKHSVLMINPDKAMEIKLARKKLAYICFGNQRQYVNIQLNEEISPEEVLLSKELIDELYLPAYPSYEIGVKGNKIIIGPYIGLLISEKDEDLTTSRLRKMLAYVREYSKLHGAVVVFALDKVDTASRLIEGYCYNPVKTYWQRGIFPYPAAFYRAIGLSKKWKNHFLAAIGDKIFNNHYFSKWEMYQWFSKNTEIDPRIPYTRLYQAHQDVLDVLDKFKKIYIKPVLGLRGRKIVQVSLENKAFVFKYRERGENCQATLENLSEVSEFMQKRFNKGRYLIQQAIELLEYEGGIVDFRCVMQKNQVNSWECKAIIGRQGDKNSVVSNISSGGKAFQVLDILAKVIPSSEHNLFILKEKMETFAVDICKALDEYGINCGTLGIDLGVDTQYRLWLIEINNRDPDPTIALDIDDEQLYYNLKTNILSYAKALAGFREMV